MSGHGIPRISGNREQDTDKEKRRIADYTAMVNEAQRYRMAQEYTLETLDLTSRLLIRNPEFYTMWNFRRHILRHLVATHARPAVELVSSDLKFLIPLLMQYPKCYWIWNYRLWLLQQMEGVLEMTDTRKLWTEEMGLVGKMLLRDERNFHGWDYRRHVVKEIERLGESGGQSLVESEFQYSTKMIQKALQNFSALHYRSQIIPRLLAERKATPAERRQFLDNELDLMQDALIDPFNQSAWFYHQFLMTTIAAGCPLQEGIVLDLTDDERTKYYDQEVGRIADILEDYDDCKWIYQALLQYHLDFNQSSKSGIARISPWFQELQRLDPTRAKRWDDLAARMKT